MQRAFSYTIYPSEGVPFKIPFNFRNDTIGIAFLGCFTDRDGSICGVAGTNLTFGPWNIDRVVLLPDDTIAVYLRHPTISRMLGINATLVMNPIEHEHLLSLLKGKP